MIKSIFFILINLLTCHQAIYALDFSITSNPPKATIYIKSPESSKRTKLGTTPIKLPVELILTNYAKGNNFMIDVEKEGYNTYHSMVSLMTPATINMNINLEISREIEITRKFDSIINSLFDSQRLIRIRNYNDALTILTDLEEKYPEISNIFEIKGGAYYLMKDFDKSLSYFRKAYSVNAENHDAYSMKLYLEKALGPE